MNGDAIQQPPNPPAAFTLERASPLDIDLDPQNPRLASYERGAAQDQLLQLMISRFKLEELAESIISAGYLPFDPLIAWRHEGRIVVLEGNRRVAALKLLLNPEVAPERFRDTWRALRGRLSQADLTAIGQVEARVYEDRDNPDVSAYVGFRHVTGVLKWPALEKAGFIARLVDQNWTYEEIAEELGSYPRHVERHFVGYRLVEQAREDQLPGATAVESKFGVLMRALQSPGILNFLGITFPGDPHQSLRPVPNDNIERLRDFLLWTFGTDERAAVVRDSRQLSDWGRILQSPEALAYLRRTPRPDFDRAWSRSGGQAESVSESLLSAADNLEQVVPLVSELTGDNGVRAGVRQCTRFLAQILVHFPDVRGEYRAQLQ